MITNITDSKALKAISGGVSCECFSVDKMFDNEFLTSTTDVSGINPRDDCWKICCNPSISQHSSTIKEYSVGGHREMCNRSSTRGRDLSRFIKTPLRTGITFISH